MLGEAVWGLALPMLHFSHCLGTVVRLPRALICKGFRTVPDRECPISLLAVVVTAVSTKPLRQPQAAERRVPSRGQMKKGRERGNR